MKNHKTVKSTNISSLTFMIFWSMKNHKIDIYQ